MSQKVYVLVVIDSDRIRNQISPERLLPVSHYLFFIVCPASYEASACPFAIDGLL